MSPIISCPMNYEKELRKIPLLFFFLFIKLHPQACVLYSHFSCVLPSVFFGCTGGIFYDKRTTNPVCLVWGWPHWAFQDKGQEFTGLDSCQGSFCF